MPAPISFVYNIYAYKCRYWIKSTTHVVYEKSNQINATRNQILFPITFFVLYFFSFSFSHFLFWFPSTQFSRIRIRCIILSLRISLLSAFSLPMCVFFPLCRLDIYLDTFQAIKKGSKHNFEIVYGPLSFGNNNFW